MRCKHLRLNRSDLAKSDTNIPVSRTSDHAGDLLLAGADPPIGWTSLSCRKSRGTAPLMGGTDDAVIMLVGLPAGAKAELRKRQMGNTTDDGHTRIR